MLRNECTVAQFAHYCRIGKGHTDAWHEKGKHHIGVHEDATLHQTEAVIIATFVVGGILELKGRCGDVREGNGRVGGTKEPDKGEDDVGV